MRIHNIIIFLFFLNSPFGFAQNCIDFSNSNSDFLDINSSWIKKHKIRAIIEKEYSEPEVDKTRLINSFWYNSSGFLEKKVNGLPNPETELLDTLNFTSIQFYSYKTIDSFLYQYERVLRNFDENGKLEQPDTLATVCSNIYNVHQKKYRTTEGKIDAEYSYNEEGKLVSISELDSFGKTIKLNYDKGNLAQIELLFSEKLDDPFLQNEEIFYEYDSATLLSKSTVKNQDISIYYFYDKNGAMIKKEMFFANIKLVSYTYSYLK